jgi:signal transduction histidine kinase
MVTTRELNSGPLQRLLAYEHALAVCARALLTSDEAAALEEAADAILAATDADFVFIDRNVIDDDLGLCLENVLTRSRLAFDPEELAVWQRRPWSEMPDVRCELEAGRPHIYQAADVAPGTDRHPDGLSRTSLKLPIFVDGTWAGHMGFAAESDRMWPDGEIRLLDLAAKMIGAYWERQQTHETLRTAVESSERWLRYERALTACAKALLMGAEDSALVTALEEMRAATDATFGFLDRLEDDPEGPVLVKVHTVAAPGVEISSDEEAFWSRVPISYMPRAWKVLAQGLPHAEVAGTTDAETLYRDAPRPILSDLKLPVMVNGELAGVLGFSHSDHNRTWTDDDMRLLHTVAQMIGSLWERNASHQRLEQLVASKDEFVASVSHELRTPLTTVVGLAHELRDHLGGFSSEEAAEFISLIAEQSSEVAHIVEDLLVAARADIDAVALAPTEVELAAELAAVVNGLADAKAARIDVRGSTGAVRADPGRLRQIIRNLITNAIRYGGSRIEVVLVDADDHALVQVRDDGAGIPDEHRHGIFTPYYRAHEHRGQPSSVGLGLSVSHHLATLMGGGLSYRHEDSWSVFELRLPKSG